MHSYELETDSVNANERDAFLSPTPARRFLRTFERADEDGGASLAHAGNEPKADWLARILSKRYLAGLPAGSLDLTDSSEISPLLRDLLARGPLPVRPANVVRAIGLAGNPEACPDLIGIIDGMSGDITVEQLAVASEAFLALGRLTALDDTGQAIDYLSTGASPATWRPRSLTLRQGETVIGELSDAFARLSILGLGLSEDPTAGARLSELDALIRSGRVEGEWLAAQVSEARIRQEGGTLRGIGTVGADRIP
jgi:hypothetical protein